MDLIRPIAIADEEVTDSAVRRLLSDRGDDIDDLTTLRGRHHKQERMPQTPVRLRTSVWCAKITDLKERDYKRLLQPVIDGNEIMEMFQLRPCREVGTLKQTLKDAVLDNRVANEREPLMQLLMQKAKEMGLVQENAVPSDT